MTTDFELQKPIIRDAPDIAALINQFSAKGLLLPRSTKFPDCDETAMLIDLTDAAKRTQDHDLTSL